MLSLHTNAASLFAQNSVSKTQNTLSTSMTRLSTGYRINSAMDDAAGLQIATRLKSQASGMAVAMRNTQNATSMMQTAEGALGEAGNILVRMKDLATQAADASANTNDQTAMQSEYDALATELTNILGNTSFGGQKLLNGAASASDISNAGTAKNNAASAASTASSTADASLTSLSNAQATYASTGTVADADAMNRAQAQYDKDLLAANTASAKSTAAIAYETAALAANSGGKFSAALDFQIGASSTEKMGLDLSGSLTAMQSALRNTSANFNAFGTAVGVTGTELTAGTAGNMIDTLTTAIDSIGSLRSSLGAAANRLEHVATNLANVTSNTQAAAGRIMDVDFATESSNMTSKQMLLQAGTAMLKQSNSMSGMVMSLLQ
jgi:flagellin